MLTLTRERIEARIAEIESQRAQHMANVHACEGAIQDCRYWLDQIAEAEKSSGKASAEVAAK